MHKKVPNHSGMQCASSIATITSFLLKDAVSKMLLHRRDTATSGDMKTIKEGLTRVLAERVMVQVHACIFLPKRYFPAVTSAKLLSLSILIAETPMSFSSRTYKAIILITCWTPSYIKQLLYLLIHQTVEGADHNCCSSWTSS